MNLLRSIIRHNIEELASRELSEVLSTKHFIDRAYDRLESSVWTTPPFTDKFLQEKIGLIDKVDFSTLESYAVRMGKYKQVYTSKNPENNKISSGDEIWLVIRENKIVSIFFRNSSQKGTPVADVDYVVDYKDIESYYLTTPKEKNGHVHVNVKALKGFKNKAAEANKVHTYKLDMPTVELGGKMWYIDDKNDVIINVKNWNKKIPIESLSDTDLEKIIEYI